MTILTTKFENIDAIRKCHSFDIRLPEPAPSSLFQGKPESAPRGLKLFRLADVGCNPLTLIIAKFSALNSVHFAKYVLSCNQMEVPDTDFGYRRREQGLIAELSPLI
jgi:hypothetical protein